MTTDQEVERDWQEFWRPIVAPNGTVDLERVKRELFDYHVVMRGASMVYSHVTGDRVSKANTDPDVVCSFADEYYESLAEVPDVE